MNVTWLTELRGQTVLPVHTKVKFLWHHSSSRMEKAGKCLIGEAVVNDKHHPNVLIFDGGIHALHFVSWPQPGLDTLRHVCVWIFGVCPIICKIFLISWLFANCEIHPDTLTYSVSLDSQCWKRCTTTFLWDSIILHLDVLLYYLYECGVTSLFLWHNKLVCHM